MWLIDRHSDGQNTRRIPLPPVVREALVRWYVGEGSRKDEEAGIMLLQQARIGERWLACDCLGDEGRPPILTPAYLSEAETYYLRRLTGSQRSEHVSGCPFFRDQATNRISEVRSRHTGVDPPEGYFEVLRPAPEQLAQKPDADSSDDRTRHASIPRLARLLWRLMDGAGVNRIIPVSIDLDDHSISDEFKALTAAASKIEIAPGIELARAMWTHAQPFQNNRVYAGLRALSHQWPRGHAPQAFLALYANAIAGSTIHLAGSDPIKIANRVQSPSIRGNIIKGPFLVLIVVGEYPEAHGYAPLRAYAQPVYSGQRFVPVDSEFERSVFRKLLDVRRRLDHHGIDLVIEKPLFDRLTQAGPCRPDFMIEAHSRSTGESKQIIIEAMGFETADYLASKAVTHPRMKLIAPIVSISPSDVEADRVLTQLSTALDL